MSDDRSIDWHRKEAQKYSTHLDEELTSPKKTEQIIERINKEIESKYDYLNNLMLGANQESKEHRSRLYEDFKENNIVPLLNEKDIFENHLKEIKGDSSKDRGDEILNYSEIMKLNDSVPLNGHFLIILDHLGILPTLMNTLPRKNQPNSRNFETNSKYGSMATELSRCLMMLFPKSFSIKQDSLRRYLSNNIDELYNESSCKEVRNFLVSGGCQKKTIESFEKKSKSLFPDISF